MVTVVSTVPHQSVVKQVVCRNCGATLEYVPADVKEHRWRDYGNSLNIEKNIECPACTYTINVDRIMK